MSVIVLTAVTFGFVRLISVTNIIHNIMNVHPVWSESFHENGRTDGHDESNSRFSKSKNRLTKTTLLGVGDGGGGVVINVTIYNLFLTLRSVD